MKNELVKCSTKAQLATLYIVYMIVGSYFKKCTCDNIFLENTLYLHYLDFPVSRQVEKEERLIALLENRYSDHVSLVKDLQCRAVFKKQKGCCTVSFLTGLEELIVSVDAKGSFRIIPQRVVEMEAQPKNCA